MFVGIKVLEVCTCNSIRCYLGNDTGGTCLKMVFGVCLAKASLINEKGG